MTNSIILIRHAQSYFNQGYLNFIQKKGTYLSWQEADQLPQFNQAVSYSQQFMDCSLSPQGIQQCKNARQQLKDNKIDIVLVSPYERALQTCQYIFGERNIKIEVHPIIAEAFRYSCDVGRKLEQKLIKFAKFDFSHMKDKQQLWFIQHLKDYHKQKINQTQNIENSSFENKRNKLLQILKQKVVFQSDLQLKERIDKFRQILKEYQKKYQNIAVVAHYHVLQFLVASKFNQKGQPLDRIIFKNATPFQYKIPQN